MRECEHLSLALSQNCFYTWAEWGQKVKVTLIIEHLRSDSIRQSPITNKQVYIYYLRSKHSCNLIQKNNNSPEAAFNCYYKILIKATDLKRQSKWSFCGPKK